MLRAELCEPRGELLRQAQLLGRAERLESRELHVSGLFPAERHQSAPQVDQALLTGLDVQVDLDGCTRHPDGLRGNTFQRDVVGQHPGAACRLPQALFGTIPVRGERQIVRQDLLDIGGGEVGDGVDAESGEGLQLAHIEGCLRDPQRQVVAVHLGQADLPPRAPLALLHPDGAHHRGRRVAGAALRCAFRHVQAELELVVVALERRT